MDTTIPQTLQEMLSNFVRFLPNLLTALVVFVAALVIAGLVSQALRRGFEKRKADPEVTLLVAKITRWLVIILGTALALEQVNFDVTTFLAGLGILGFTVGFAIQDVSKNFVAGLLLLLQQPFEIGETVEVADYIGIVQAVDLRATQIRTLDGRYVLIPNADVFINPIVNLTRPPLRRIGLEVGVDYASDLEEVRRVALEAIGQVTGLAEDPAPQVVFHTFGGSTVDLTVYFWFDNSLTTPLIAKDEGLKAVKVAFEAAGIGMPFPTQAILLKKES